MTLPQAYASPPGRPGKYCLYISRDGEDDTQSMAVVFAASYAARKFLDVLLEDDEIEWWENPFMVRLGVNVEGCTIRSSSSIVVSTRWWPDRMRKVVEHEYSLEEMGWQLRNPMRQWAVMFRNGPNFPRTLEEDGHVREKRERKPVQHRAPRDGLTPVADIATALGMEPREVRGILRGLKIEKPAAGWAWPAEKAAEIQSLIEKHRKS